MAGLCVPTILQVRQTSLATTRIEKTASRELGDVYTPPQLARWLAEEVLRFVNISPSSLVLDLACGDGALLHAFDGASPVPVRLAGADVDPAALTTAKVVLPERCLLFRTDALAPDCNSRPEEFWVDALGGRRPDAILMNPPWGIDLAQSPPELAELGFTLAQGQFDSYALFVELAARLVAPHGIVAAILPDSLLAPEHEPVRRLIATETEMVLIGRLGEGFFEGVYRGTVVMLFRGRAPRPAGKVECFRLTPAWRRRVLSGALPLSACRIALSHAVGQDRFAADPHCRFDLDLTSGEERVVRLLESHPHNWTDGLISGRGVELSKTGLVVDCTRCETSIPAPRRAREVECRNCGGLWHADGADGRRIIKPVASSSGKSWVPLIVGEDVRRYRAEPSRAIQTDVKGIDYKLAVPFERRKLLVRKTGLGINATIDDSGCLTTQVVFHYVLPPISTYPDFYLDYVLGVLNSRIMLAYHLRRTGETEWRSHPYVTQRTLSQLPIPTLERSEIYRQAEAIAAAARALLRYPQDVDRDLRLESLVAGLYGMESDDLIWVARVLEGAATLEGIRALRLPDYRLIGPIHA